jgi:hypothetical protein
MIESVYRSNSNGTQQEDSSEVVDSVLKSSPVQSFAFSVMQLDQDQLLAKAEIPKTGPRPVSTGL